jgi:tRNA(Ile)-lysidine synthase
LKQTVLKYIQENNLINYGDTVICGLSGGADSCAMVSVLNSLKKELGINLICAHLNHMLRGEEAENDMKFAENFSLSLNIPFYSRAVNVKKLAEEKGVSLEDAGRIARYEFFEDLLNNCGVVVTPGEAFHANNCVRISCLAHRKQIEHGAKILKEFLK